jgi:hypothetical protein
MAFNLRNGAPTYMAPRAGNATPFVTGGSSAGSIAGTATASNGLWVGARNTFGYQWYRGTASIANATSASYAVAATDRTASYVTCKVTVTNPWGSKSKDAVYAITLP